MKKIFLFLVTLISVVLLSSCGPKPVGEFQVIAKGKMFPKSQNGFVILANSSGDTLKAFTPENDYLNIKIGDTRLVLEGYHGALILDDKTEDHVVGYSKIILKKIDKGVPSLKVITRGQDTISINLVEKVVFYNVSEGDSVFVKINQKRCYFVE